MHVSTKSGRPAATKGEDYASCSKLERRVDHGSVLEHIPREVVAGVVDLHASKPTEKSKPGRIV